MQLCGDAHLSNFGAFAAPDRRLVFGINDFDETLPGPFEWDVKRLVASFAIAGRDRGFDERATARRSTSRSDGVPRVDAALRGDAEPRLWYARLDVEDTIQQWPAGDDKHASAWSNVAKARRRTASRPSPS